MAKILVVDDDKHVRHSIGLTLKVDGHDVDAARSGEAAIRMLDTQIYDLVICDLVMEQTSGIDVLRHSRQVYPDVEVIMMTAFASIDNAVEAMREGAYDYLTKPFNEDVLRMTVAKALERNELRNKVRNLERNMREQFGVENIIAANPRMQRLLRNAISVAHTDSTILITGESGTGKELIARAIHDTSRHSEKPFIAVNCGALPENLLESELFGHVKGAFTGAVSNKKGLVEEANGGTLFLDEIAETSLTLQVKLLRFIQEGEIRRVGENTTRHVKVRLIAATNKDLKQAMAENLFREDLYYRLSVIPLHIPPLRERPEDIPLLAQHFLKLYARRFDKNIKTFSKETSNTMLNYPWPGNVRELINTVEHGVAMCHGDKIELNDMPQSLIEYTEIVPGFREGLTGSLAEVEKNYILKVLQDTHWNQKRACAILGLSKTTLYRRLKQYGIQARLMQTTSSPGR